MGLRVIWFELSEAQICDLEFTVVWGSSVPAKYEDISWFDILVQTEKQPVSALPVEAAKYVPVQNLGNRLPVTDSTVDALDTMYNVH